MKRTFFILCVFALSTLSVRAVDMQAHMGTAEAQAAYSTYLNKQSAYYTGDYSYSNLSVLYGNNLFGALNALMGSTSQIGNSSFTYNSLRPAYVNVDKDLNTAGNIIGYYDGRTMNGTWDSGKTYNREHTWPQSKGANKDIPMGHDMQSVRPTSVAVNSDRGNTAYGESSGYYDPNEVSINNSLYVSTNLGSYRGDAARVIIYDYVVYGEAGGHKNTLYNGNAQLLSKLGSNGVFESIPVLLKWHMQDPVSLTEMVRNDGGQNYQGNRNPFIDYPELAIQMFKDASGVTTYDVTTAGVRMWRAYQLTLSSGFIAYLGTPNNRPTKNDIVITGATYTYDESNGRLTVKSVSGNMTITGPYTDIDQTKTPATATKIIRNGQILILKNGKAYTIMGLPVDAER